MVLRRIESLRRIRFLTETLSSMPTQYVLGVTTPLEQGRPEEDSEPVADAPFRHGAPCDSRSLVGSRVLISKSGMSARVLEIG